jgi:hypothetical protein
VRIASNIRGGDRRGGCRSSTAYASYAQAREVCYVGTSRNSTDWSLAILSLRAYQADRGWAERP